MSLRNTAFMAVLVVYVRQTLAAPIDALLYSSNPTGTSCASLAEGAITDVHNCDGGFEREMTVATNGRHNVIPQADSDAATAYVIFKFEGSLAQGSYLSLVDSQISPSDPCTSTEAGHLPDQQHSGPMKSTVDGDPASAVGQIVRLNQSNPAHLLTHTKEYVVCHATGDGSTSDSTWTSSNIVLSISRVSRLNIYGKEFRTCGDAHPCVIPSHDALTVRYYGTLDDDRWISLVDSSLNNNAPCANGHFAAGAQDQHHTGSRLASGNVFTIDSEMLSADSTFTVCYAESGGLPSSTWKDTGLRLKPSAIPRVKYGVDTLEVGDGVDYTASNRNHDDNDLVPTDRLPQTSNLMLSVSQTADVQMISLVDASLGHGQPCMYGQIASGSADGLHTGTFSVTSGSVTIDASTLDLEDGSGSLRVYALCYKPHTGEWGDSYVRYSVSALGSLGHHGAKHVTTGAIPYQEDIQFILEGATSLTNSPSSNYTKIALVLEFQDTNLRTNALGFSTYAPCNNSVLSEGGAFSANYTAGTVEPLNSAGQRRVIFNTTSLHTGTIINVAGKDQFGTGPAAIAGATRPLHTFAVCYQLRDSTNDNTHMFHDSGIRVTVSKVSKITHGETSSPYEPYDFYPGPADIALPLSGQASARQVIPNIPNQAFAYHATPIAGSALGNAQYFSLVDSTRNAYKPCVLPTIAARLPDTTHSGTLTSDAGTTTVNIPMDIPLDDTKTYAVCYAITSGSIADESWTDTYIRVTASSVKQITSLGVAHKVNTFISTIASRNANIDYSVFYYKKTTPSKLPVTYAGTLSGSNYLSIVDATLNGNFPCAQDSTATGQTGSLGHAPVQAGIQPHAHSAKTALFTTAGFDTTKVYAICYSTASASGYHDTGIRVMRSVVESIQHHSGHNNPAPREMTSVEFDTNTIPAFSTDQWAKDVRISYTGSITPDGNNLWIALVKATENNGDPCVNSLVVKGSDPPGSTTTGRLVVQASDSTYSFIQNVTNATGLESTKYAVCYATGDGSSSDSSYRDSYIRLTLSLAGALDHNVGRYSQGGQTHREGSLIRHRTDGQLPNTAGTSASSLGLTIAGYLQDQPISFVDADDAQALYMEDEITYQKPCTLSPTYASHSSTTGTGLLFPTNVTHVTGSLMQYTHFEQFDSSILDTSKVYAMCYRQGIPGMYSYHDSGLRFTISKIKEVIWHTIGSTPRQLTPLFLPTSRLPQWTSRQLQVSGSSDLIGKYISIVRDDQHPGHSGGESPVWRSGPIDGAGNPCSTPAYAAQTASDMTSGVLPLTKQRTCNIYDEYRAAAGTPLNTTINVDSASHSRVRYGDAVAWTECRDACEADAQCASVVYDKRAGRCFPASTDPGTEDTSSYSNWIYGAGGWISSRCSTGSVDDSVFVPQWNGTYLSEGDYTATYAICYSEFASDTSSPSSGSSTDLWMDSYVRFSISPLASLETSGTEHWTSGDMPAVGEPIAEDYYDDSLAHHFIYHGQRKDVTKIKMIHENENNGYPCVASQWAISPVVSTVSLSPRSDISNNSANSAHHLLSTWRLDPAYAFAVCIYNTDTGNIGDSGIRLSRSKVTEIRRTTSISATSGHDAISFGPRTSKAGVRNRLPRQANIELMYAVGTFLGNASVLESIQALSWVRTTLNNGKPCQGPNVDDPASEATSGPVQLSHGAFANRYFRIPQDVLLGSSQPDWRFRVCYLDSTDNTWHDTYITYEMTDITALKIHIPLSTGLRGSASDAADASILIDDTGQIPNERAMQTTRYEILGGGSLPTTVSLVDASDNQVQDLYAAGTQSNPVLNSGYRRPDPCRATQHADTTTASQSWSAWQAARGLTATHGTVSGGYILGMDTTQVNSSKLFALCYGGSSGPAYDSGIRLTISQVTAIHVHDIQGRSDRTREITSVIKPYNVIPSSAASLTVSYEGQFASKSFFLREASDNSHNPCIASINVGSMSDATEFSFNISGLQPDVQYAVCYAPRRLNSSEVVNDELNDWIRSTAYDALLNLLDEDQIYQTTFRDSYIRVLASEIQTIVSSNVEFNIRGQLASHPELKIDYTGTLVAGAQLALVDERLNIMTVGHANYSFPCSGEFGLNADMPTKAPGACTDTSNCTHTGVATASSQTVTMDTTDLDTQAVFAVCYSQPDGAMEKWRDSGVRVTLPEIQALSMASNYAGTPPRVLKSWDTSDGTTVLDRPTSRLPAYANQVLSFHKHPSAPTSRVAQAQFALVQVSSNPRQNPCTEVTNISPVPVCPSANSCIQSGIINGTSRGPSIGRPGSADAATGQITIPQGANQLLLRASGDGTSGIFTLCYKSANSSDGTIQGLTYSHPLSHTPSSVYLGSTVDWEDTYIRFKISSVRALIAAGHTHVTTGQLPNTVIEQPGTRGSTVANADVPGYEFIFSYQSDPAALAGDKRVALVDSTQNPQANGEGLPCVNVSSAVARSATNYDWSNKYYGLNESKIYAFCYEDTGSWSDSGIRVTVSAISILSYSSGHNGLDTNLDTGSRAMTATVLPTNTLPRDVSTEVSLTFSASMLPSPGSYYVSLVQVDSGSNPCIIPGTQQASTSNDNNAARTAPALANNHQATLLQPSNNLLKDGELYAVCYDAGTAATPEFVHSAECGCDLLTSANARDNCLTACRSNVVTGQANSYTWRDSYIRIRISNLGKLGVVHGVNTAITTRKTIWIQTNGGIPATSANQKQVVFASHPLRSNFIQLVYEHQSMASSPDNTGIIHYTPCNSSSPSNGNRNSSAAVQNANNITIMQTDHLDTEKTYAVCYASQAAGVPQGWQDSGMRVTVSKVQSVHYLGDVPYSSAMLNNEQSLLSLRDRKMTAAKTALNTIPLGNFKLRWDGPSSGWPSERVNSSNSELLAAGKYLSIVSTSLNGGNPCVHPHTWIDPNATGSFNERLSTGVMQGTEYSSGSNGIWVSVSQDSNAGTILAKSSSHGEYAICFGEGDGGLNDAWRDSFIRVETSSVISISQTVVDSTNNAPTFTHRYKTTGQLASSTTLQLTYEGRLEAGKQLNLVHSLHNQQIEDIGLDSFPFPCHVSAPAASANTSGPATATVRTASVDTVSMHRSDTSSEEIVYAVCYNEGSFWEDSGIRTTLTEVSEIVYRSGRDRGIAPNTKALTLSTTSVADGGTLDIDHDYYDYAWEIDTKFETKARHMDSKYAPTNRLALMAPYAVTPATYDTINYVTVPHSSMAEAAGNDKQLSFVAESHATSWASPCDQDQIAGASDATSTYSGTYYASGGNKIITFNSTLLTSPERYAVCYNSDGQPGSWRDSYVRVMFSKIRSIETLGIETRTTGMIPNVKLSEELEFKYHGVLGPGESISLVDETINGNNPCHHDSATTPANCNACPSVDGLYSGVHVASPHLQMVTTMDTSGLSSNKTFAVCYSAAGVWDDSGIRVRVPKIHTLTLPFDGDFNTDSCRTGSGTCTTQDRAMTSYPRPTNTIARVGSQILRYTGSGISSTAKIALVDSALNSGHPCFDPSIPGGSVTLSYSNGGTAPNSQSQKTAVATASNNLVTISQAVNHLLYGASEAVGGATYELSLGKSYAVCYTEGDGGNSDLGWTDSYIRLKPSDLVSFGTKDAQHYTYGQVPHHSLQGYGADRIGLEYYYYLSDQSLMDNGPTGNHYITLVSTAVDTLWQSNTSLDATVLQSDLSKITFSTVTSSIPESTTLEPGYRIRVGAEERTIVYVDSGAQHAWVSSPFSAAFNDFHFVYLSNTNRNTGSGFANQQYDPCTVVQGPDNQFASATDMDHIERAQPAGSGSGGIVNTDTGGKYRTVNVLDTTKMRPKTQYAVCYSPNTADGDATKNDWFDAGIRVTVSELVAVEYSGYKRGVLGFPTAYRDGYVDSGEGDCTGTQVTSHYYHEARYSDADCRAKCDQYTDCLGYQASTIAVPRYGARGKHCKVWQALGSASTLGPPTGNTLWGNSHCMRKTSGNDQITRGKSHRKIQSVAMELQGGNSDTHDDIAATVLPRSPTLDLIYSGSLATASYISLVALSHHGVHHYSNPCGNAVTAATATSTSSGPVRACYSPGPGYVNDIEGEMYPRPGGLCKPSGTICADQHASIQATLVATGCPNTNKNFVSASLMASFDTALNVSTSTLAAELNLLCEANGPAMLPTFEQQSACCGQDVHGNPISCETSCALQSQLSDCSADVSQESNKEVSFNMATLLNANEAGYTVCYTDGDGSVTDTNWRDSFIRVSLSNATGITASGVEHRDHGHLASHDSQSMLDIEISGVLPGGTHELLLARETLSNNNPCIVTDPVSWLSANAPSDAWSVSAPSSTFTVAIKTSHLNTTYQFAVCYGSGTKFQDTGIRVRTTELTNIKYNTHQRGGDQLASTGQYTRDMTAARVRVGPSDQSFLDTPDGFYGTHEEIRSTVASHVLPHIHGSSIGMEYSGDLGPVHRVGFAPVTSNYGDPCALASSIVAFGSSTGTYLFEMDTILRSLDPAQEYTTCYDSRSGYPSLNNESRPFMLNSESGGPMSLGHWQHGQGKPVRGWRDAYIHFKVSIIEYASSHGMKHRTQGSIANSNHYKLGLVGSIAAGRISLVENSNNNYVPCRLPYTTDTSNDYQTGAMAVQVPEGFNNASGVQVEIDTSRLKIHVNYAICYEHSSQWYDSGIRTTVSAIRQLIYNTEQPTEVPTRVYQRLMPSDNMYSVGASDSYPIATNRLPMGGSSSVMLEFVNSDRSFLNATGVELSFIDASILDGDGPCHSAAVANASSDSTHLKPLPSNSSVVELDTSGSYLSAVSLIAVCYFDSSTAGRPQWQDTYIRLEPSKIRTVTAYGIEHKTFGDIPRKESLYVGTSGTLSSTGTLLQLVSSVLNTNRPCIATSPDPSHIAYVGQLATEASKTDMTNSSTLNNVTANSHRLDTSQLDPAKTYAICYAESNQSFQDSGLRVRVPNVDTLSYAAPARSINADSCTRENLWGVADCNPSKTCVGSHCYGGDPSSTCGHDETQSCTVIPRDNGPTATGTQFTFSGPGDISQVLKLSFVKHTLGAQANNPCRDASIASQPANSLGTSDQRHTSGPLTTNGGQFTLPQLSDSGGNNNLLQENGTFAVCYTTGSGDASDSSWRDTYVRVTLSKIAYIQGSDMIVKTRGMLANVPSLRFTYHGSLGFHKWINLVEVTANSNVPCNKVHAERLGEQCAEGCQFDPSTRFHTLSTATAALCKIACQEATLCKAYTFIAAGAMGTCDLHPLLAGNAYPTQNVAGAYSGVMEQAYEQSGWLQADPAEEFVDFDTTSLTADALYTVCYADSTSPSPGAPGAGDVWKDSAIRLRFVKWTNSEKSRIASGSASIMSFSINQGGFDLSNDYFALIKDATDCTSAPGAPLLSNGTHVKKTVETFYNGSITGFAMPSGTGASYRATAYRQCRPILQGPERLDMANYEACSEPGKYQDTNLQEGSYTVCFCDSDNGNGLCDQPNEWIKLSSSGVTPAMLTVVQTPRIGRAYESFGSSSHVGSVRAITGISHTYNIKTTDTAGLEIKNNDKIYFHANCDSVPASDSNSSTAPIAVTGYDSDSSSLTYKSARVVTPATVPLKSSSASAPRALVSCFATQESLMGPGGVTPREFVQLADGLEITPLPRLGTNAVGSPSGVIRLLTQSSPVFDALFFRPGDKIFLKEMSTYNWQLTGTLEVGSNQCNYASSETCQCSVSGVLSCTNPNHFCRGFSCIDTIPEGADTDCTEGSIAVDGVVTSVVPSSNSAAGTALFEGLEFFETGVAGTTVNHVVTMTNDFLYAIDGQPQKELVASVGITYVFNMDSQTNDLDSHPMVFSASEGGEHNHQDVHTTDMTFTLDGKSRSLVDFITYFNTATTRSITYTPTVPITLYYYSATLVDTALTFDRMVSDPQRNLQKYVRTDIGSSMTVNRDDSGTFQLPTDVPLQAKSLTEPRFLSVCFIPAGSLEKLHAPAAPGAANCSYSSPHDTTCTNQLVNAHRLPDYAQVLPEPTQNLKLTHNSSEIYSLKFNEPSFGTYWRTTNHWCEGDEFLHPCGVRSSDRGTTGSSYLCCQPEANFAAASPGDVIVLKKEVTPGSGDCHDVHLITDEDYFIGSQHTRKMSLTSIDDDRTTQTSPERSDLSQGLLRSPAERGAEASHHSLASGKVNELPEGYYSICYATAESRGDDAADFHKLAVSLEITPKSAVGPSFTVPRTVLKGQNINVQWSAHNDYNTKTSEEHSWIGLYVKGECPNGSGEFQNKCYLASQTVDVGKSQTGIISFGPSDYQNKVGTFEVRYFHGGSRDAHGIVCRGLPNVPRDTYIACVFEASMTSSSIQVYDNINDMEATSIPGLEFVFDGEVARYAGNGAGFPGHEHVENAPNHNYW